MAAFEVNKLLESFEELDSCISTTKAVLDRKPGVPQELLARVNQYSEIVSKQKELTAKLKDHISKQNWSEVSRHVRLINGLSAMIREDAQAILGKLSSSDSEESGSINEELIC